MEDRLIGRAEAGKPFKKVFFFFFFFAVMQAIDAGLAWSGSCGDTRSGQIHIF